MQTIGKIIKSFKSELNNIYPETEIRAIVEIVFEHLFGFSKTDLILKSENLIEESETIKIETFLKRLKDHEPIQYILGYTYFYKCFFNVDENVLIPRPETEELVDWIIAETKNNSDLQILDIGTGSGCIAVSLAVNLKNPVVYAMDVSQEALQLTLRNAEKNRSIVNIIKDDILNPVQNSENLNFDIIVSNPPYVLISEKEKMQKNVLDYEPELALFVKDEDPLLFYKAVVNYSKKYLKPCGKLYFEINETLGSELLLLLEKSGFVDLKMKKDINGKDRMVSGKFI